MTRLIVGLAVAWAVSCPPARADALYTVDTEGTDGQTLHTLSTADGSSTLVGSLGVGGYLAGLAYDPVDRVLYGTTSETENLYSIDPSFPDWAKDRILDFHKIDPRGDLFRFGDWEPEGGEWWTDFAQLQTVMDRLCEAFEGHINKT